VSIRELAELIPEVVGYEGPISFDVTKPGGTPRNFLDVSKMRGLGWEVKIPLRESIEQITVGSQVRLQRGSRGNEVFSLGSVLAHIGSWVFEAVLASQ